MGRCNRYSLLADRDDSLASDLADGSDLAGTVRHMYRRYAQAVARKPRLTPALIAEGLSRPDSDAGRAIVEQNTPRLIDPLRRWLHGGGRGMPAELHWRC